MTSTAPAMQGIPTASELINRARSLAPLISAHAEENAKKRSIAPEVIEELRRAGLFRILQPRRWGGYELPPSAFLDVQFEIARADMSTGWVYGVLGVHNFQMGLFDDRAAQDVWSENDNVQIASTFQPGGIATPTPGGYHFSGQWKFASGCDHADWIFLGGRLGDEFLTCLLPREQYEIIDTWHASGLHGTGSKDILVKDVIIPEYRVHRSSDGFRCDSPGNKVNTGWLYRLPFHQVFIRAITGASTGALQAMVDAFLDYASRRVSVVAGATIKDPDALLALGEAIATIDQINCIMRRNFTVLEGYAKQGMTPPFEERLLYKYQAASVTRLCLDAAQTLFEHCGGTGLFSGQPFGRILNDLVAAKQHAAAQNHLSARSLGGSALGQEVNEWYL